MTDQTHGRHAPALYRPADPVHEREHAAVYRARPDLPARLTVAEAFWYVLMNVSFAAGYFAKVPVKKALDEAGLAVMTSWERFWYVVMCIPFGAAYFLKVPVKMALTEIRP